MNLHEHLIIPWRELVIPQIINFTIFMGLLIYFVKNPLKRHFAQKHEAYVAQKKLAETSRFEAEKQNYEAHDRLKLFEEKFNSSITDAQKEAAAIKQKLIEDARAQAQRMAQESEMMAHFEHGRAIAALRQELILNSTDVAAKKLKSTAGETAQVGLEEEFINKVQAARI